MIVIVMGVSGVGKTTVGERLARQLGWTLVEADVLHPPENIRKMAAGITLSEGDRLPWLQRVHASILAHEAEGRSAVIACSALRESYRRLLREKTRDVRLVFLRCDLALIEKRLNQRQDHFFDPTLLASQFEALEEPADALVVDGAGDPRDIVAVISRALAAAAGMAQ